MDIYESALRKIREAERFRPNCCNIINIPTGPTGTVPGATGPTGPTGATERLFKSSNRIIID